jgi:hypothetical protein
MACHAFLSNYPLPLHLLLLISTIAPMCFKPTLLLVSLITFAFSASSQTRKGNKMVGFSLVSAFFNNGTTDRSNDISSSTIENDNFGISINPNVGWFISDDVAVGISPSISYSKQKQVGKGANGNTFLSDEVSMYGVSVGGFARYYFKGQPNLRFFGQYNLNLGIAGGKNEGYEYESLGIYVDRYESKYSGGFKGNTGVSFGASKFLNDHVAIDFIIGYNFSFGKSEPEGTSVREYADPSTPDQTQTIKFEQKVTGNDIQLGIGLQVFLDKKKTR